MALDFFIAKQHHRMWMINMRAFLLDIEDFEADKVAKHTDCNLGKWIYKEAINVFADFPAFVELEKIHKDLHECIVEIIQFKKANEMNKAQEKLKDLDAISARILDLLDEMEKETINS